MFSNNGLSDLQNKKIQIGYYQSPLGLLKIVANQVALLSIQFVKSKKKGEQHSKNPIIESCKQQLEEYFAHQRSKFLLPLVKQGTPFQNKVWTHLQKIPFGATQTYQQVAQAIAQAKAMRAVGTANGRNPWVIVVPCHRVVAKNGLGGYSCGLSKKKWLLKHEGIK